MALASGPLAFVQRGNSVFGRASALRPSQPLRGKTADPISGRPFRIVSSCLLFELANESRSAFHSHIEMSNQPIVGVLGISPRFFGRRQGLQNRLVSDVERIDIRGRNTGVSHRGLEP